MQGLQVELSAVLVATNFIVGRCTASDDGWCRSSRVDPSDRPGPKKARLFELLTSKAGVAPFLYAYGPGSLANSSAIRLASSAVRTSPSGCTAFPSPHE
jgi:hypothetical protein